MDFIKGAVAAAGDAITALMQQYDTPEWLVSQYLDVANPLPDLDALPDAEVPSIADIMLEVCTTIDEDMVNSLSQQQFVLLVRYALQLAKHVGRWALPSKMALWQLIAARAAALLETPVMLGNDANEWQTQVAKKVQQLEKQQAEAAEQARRLRSGKASAAQPAGCHQNNPGPAAAVGAAGASCSVAIGAGAITGAAAGAATRARPQHTENESGLSDGLSYVVEVVRATSVEYKMDLQGLEEAAALLEAPGSEQRMLVLQLVLMDAAAGMVHHWSTCLTAATQEKKRAAAAAKLKPILPLVVQFAAKSLKLLENCELRQAMAVKATHTVLDLAATDKLKDDFRSAGLDKVWAKGLRSLVATSKASFPAGVQDLPVRWGLRHLLRLLIAYLKAAGDRAARYWPVLLKHLVLRRVDPTMCYVEPSWSEAALECMSYSSNESVVVDALQPLAKDLPHLQAHQQLAIMRVFKGVVLQKPGCTGQLLLQDGMLQGIITAYDSVSLRVQRQALRLTDVLVEAAFTTGKGVGTLGSKEPQRGVLHALLPGLSQLSSQHFNLKLAAHATKAHDKLQSKLAQVGVGSQDTEGKTAVMLEPPSEQVAEQAVGQEERRVGGKWRPAAQQKGRQQKQRQGHTQKGSN